MAEETGNLSSGWNWWY